MADRENSKPGARKAQAVNKKPAKAPGGKAQEAARTAGMVEQATQFMREVRSELKKVTWPGRKQTIASTVVVLALVVVVSVFLGLVDLTLSRLVGFLIG